MPATRRETKPRAWKLTRNQKSSDEQAPSESTGAEQADARAAGAGPADPVRPAADEATSNADVRGEGLQDVRPREHGGRDGPEPTRFGDWEKGGRCIDF